MISELYNSLSTSLVKSKRTFSNSSLHIIRILLKLSKESKVF
jgi:hypothetical protein